MAEYELSKRYVDEQTVESSLHHAIRVDALANNLPVVSKSLAAHLAFIASTSGSDQIMQIGATGGVAGAALHRGAPSAIITTIDRDSEALDRERRSLLRVGHAPAWIRNISGDPLRVLPRMSESSYDLVLISATLDHVAAHITHALRLVKPGGTILVLNALNHGRVADPARRDAVTQSLRTLIREFSSHPDFVVATLALDGGLLQISVPAR